MNNTVAKQCLWPICAIKRVLNWIASQPKFELQGMPNVCNRHINAFTFKMYRNKNLRCSLKATADAAVKG